MARIPKKLKKDAIVDAVCEIRFECREAVEAPELVVGFLASNSAWRSFQKSRLPAADIPEQLRHADPDLRNHATLELVDANSGRRVRVGPRTISTGRQNGYPGWPTMLENMQETVDHAFASLEEFRVCRIGLRYVNVLEPEFHNVETIHDLRFRVVVDESPLNGAVNLNFMKSNEGSHSTVRIASPEFVNSIDPANGVGVIDIDTVCARPELVVDTDSFSDWAVSAHELEKETFFGLFSPESLDAIVEEWHESNY